MRVLLDTNVLARLAQPSNPQRPIAGRAIEIIRLRDDEPCVVPQVLYELWVVCTRPPSANGLGMDPRTARGELDSIARFATLLRDERAIYQQWQQLVTECEARGKPAHDARLVAAMLRHGVTHILTFNADDFRRYRGIGVLTPSELAAELP